MELGRFSWWVVLVLVQLCINGCFGCLEQEKIALLRLKASMNDPDGYSLPSWNSAKEESECCDWEGVKCNITTGRVIQLALNYTWFEHGLWYVNASLFLPFEELNYLDLSYNFFPGCIPNEGFEKFSRLSKLEVLYLDYNFFNNSILSSVSGITSLKKLYLRGNALNGSIHIQGI
ncbi:receptor-like protein 15 [Fagus crenata]